MLTKTAALAACALAAVSAAASAAATLEHRWVYLPMNLLVDKNIDEGIGILERAAKAGYTGVVVCPSSLY